MNTEPLRKVLELERKKGYPDGAVIGGLDRFLGNWAGHAAEAVTSPRRLSRFRRLLVDTRYADLTVPQRKEWADRVTELLDELESGGKAPSPPVVKPSPPPAAPAPARPPSPPAAAAAALDSPITAIRGISAALAARFGKMGVHTIRDLLYFFPHRHLDYSRRTTISEITEGDEQTVIANVWQAGVATLGGRRGTEAIVGDETGNMRAVWFNQPYLAKKLPPNTRVVLSGRVSLFKGRHVFESPEWEVLEDRDLVHTGRLVPVYPLTRGLRPRSVRKLMKQVVDDWAWRVEDFLPEEIKQRRRLLSLPEAIARTHYPEDSTAKDRARTRIAFDELFLLQLGVMGRKHRWQENQPASAFRTDVPLLKTFLESLPFSLTAAQRRVLQEILADLRKPHPMSRLLQGEVGSGKTVVATAALLAAVANGRQAAFMAPTEILAEQHFATLGGLLARAGREEKKDGYLASYTGLAERPLTVGLLIGDTASNRKRDLHRAIKAGEVDIIIGTHALIQKEVGFRELGLVIVDEQHRFGVEQRSALRGKGFRPHMLVMTATPIPRSLALTLYGDLDLSVIDELPPGRQVIKTRWLQPGQRPSAYAFLRRQIAADRQVFIICPLIEESEAVQAQAAVAEYERLSREVFPDFRLGLLHGRLSSEEKDRVMHAFRAGELDILVTTPVVEVGIDVPNATVMLVESADRFGLSQLHQFRGRVGRGEEQSYCMLMALNPSEVSRERLDIIERTLDGFLLAEEDLKLRGPGEFFGTRQSGIPDLRMARLTDMPLLEMARGEAEKIFELDPELEMPSHHLMAIEMACAWPQVAEWS